MSLIEVKEQVLESLSQYTAEDFRKAIISNIDRVDENDRDVIVELLGLRKDRPQKITNKESFLKWARGAKSADLEKLYPQANRIQGEAAVWRFERSASQDKSCLLEMVETGESSEVAAVARVLPNLIDGEVEAHCVRCHRDYDITEGRYSCTITHSEPDDWERVCPGYEEVRGRLPCCNRWVYPYGHPFDCLRDRLEEWEDEPCDAEELDDHVASFNEIIDPKDPAVVAARRACKVCRS